MDERDWFQHQTRSHSFVFLYKQHSIFLNGTGWFTYHPPAKTFYIPHRTRTTTTDNKVSRAESLLSIDCSSLVLVPHPFLTVSSVLQPPIWLLHLRHMIWYSLINDHVTYHVIIHHHHLYTFYYYHHHLLPKICMRGSYHYHFLIHLHIKSIPYYTIRMPNLSPTTPTYTHHLPWPYHNHPMEYSSYGIFTYPLLST